MSPLTLTDKPSKVEKKQPLQNIPITRPTFGPDEETAVIDTLRSGWVVQGPKVKAFEQMVAEFTGAKEAIATTSCTSALHLTLIALGIGPENEVLLPSFTFIATANAVEYTGARPVFIDIDPKTYTIDPHQLRKYLEHPKNRNNRPRCLIPVSLFGLCADMTELNKIAGEHNLTVIEDAACALGAFHGEHHAGTETSAGCFSFHPRKAISTGEGGMVITNDTGLASKIRRLRDHGASKTDLERHLSQGGSLLPEYHLLGYNYRMTDIQAAIGVEQMKKASEIIEYRRTSAQRYNQILNDMPQVLTPVEPENYRHAYQSYVCLYVGEDIFVSGLSNFTKEDVDRLNRQRNKIMAYMEENGIAVRQGTHAVHTLDYYKKKYDLKDFSRPMSYLADRLSITLPLYYQMTLEDQQRVALCLKEAICKYRE